MRKPNLSKREYDIFSELGLETKGFVWDWSKPSLEENSGHTQSEWGLNNMTKQNLSKGVKPLDTKD